MTLHDVPKWWAQLLGEGHPAIKHYEQFLRDIHDPDDPDYIWTDSPDMIMYHITSMWIRKLPQRAKAIIAQELLDDLIGLDLHPYWQMEERDLVHPDQEVA